jgi:hypothetical protein
MGADRLRQYTNAYGLGLLYTTLLVLAIILIWKLVQAGLHPGW